tara:strand:+ start:706 stop:957 length:252 start_codon:yes stop_codon:yes gene_type:complete
MKIYLVIQMADTEMVSVETFHYKAQAERVFESVMREDSLLEPSSIDLNLLKDHELFGTLRIAGDDAGSVQLIERTIVDNQQKI